MTIKKINKELNKKLGNVCLVKSVGYFYVASEDKEIGLRLAQLDSTSIYVCHLNQQSLEEWVEDVKFIWNQIS